MFAVLELPSVGAVMLPALLVFPHGAPFPARPKDNVRELLLVPQASFVFGCTYRLVVADVVKANGEYPSATTMVPGPLDPVRTVMKSPVMELDAVYCVALAMLVKVRYWVADEVPVTVAPTPGPVVVPALLLLLHELAQVT